MEDSNAMDQIASVRGRITDLEDRLEHFMKRDTARTNRALKTESQTTLSSLQNPEQTKAEKLASLRERMRGRHVGNG
jgi:hypothetical protein